MKLIVENLNFIAFIYLKLILQTAKLYKLDFKVYFYY